jgi:hypothetical protein
MITTVCSELACQLRNIIKQFVADVMGEVENGRPHDDIHVIITGGDGELFRLLLDRNASDIIHVEPEVEPIPDFVKITYSKNFAHYGINNLLYQKCLQRPVDPYEELRNKMQSARVAMKSAIEKSGITRGTVLSVDFDPPSMEQPTAPQDVSNYSFLIRHDETAKQRMLRLKDFYGKEAIAIDCLWSFHLHFSLDCLGCMMPKEGLLLYDEVGEAEANDPNNELSTEKKSLSRELQEILLSKSEALRARKVELQQYIDDGGLKDYFGCQTKDEKEAKRRKLAKRNVVENPKQFVGKRVAKEFAVQDPESDDPEKMVDAIFFGTVRYLSDEAKVWYYVKYDDGDGEELDLKDLKWALKLYEANKKDDSTKGVARDDYDIDAEEAKIEIDHPMFYDSDEKKQGEESTLAAKATPSSEETAPLATNGDAKGILPVAKDGGDKANASISFITL